MVESETEKAVTPVDTASKDQAEQAKPEVGGRTTLPHFDPLSPLSSGSLEEACAKVRITRLQLEAQEKARAQKAEL